jgi:alpha-L-fucosidase
MKKTIFFLLCIVVSQHVFSQSFQSKEKQLEWWQDARFGMFIHWGPVTLKGTEIGWSRGGEVPIDVYDNLYKEFNPVHFDADAWVKLAKDAGMKYIVFTSKHHDGFCMWDTKYNDYNIMHTPFKRDVTKELAEACKKYEMAFGIYHSTCDWRHPDFPKTSPRGGVWREEYNLDRYTEYLKNQSAELVQNYGPLAVMWYDMPQEFDSIRGQSVVDRIRSIQPSILVNERTGAKGDFDTPEQTIGGFELERPWETCMTIARQWAWKPNDEVKTLEQCIQGLVRTAGGNGNLLFNIGPKPDGNIEPEQVTRLKEMGSWLQKYGHTIYGTRGGPFKPTDWGVSTRKDNKIYLHILNWIGTNRNLKVPTLHAEILDCTLLTGGEIAFTKEDGYYNFEFSENSLNSLNTIIEITLDKNVMDVEPLEAKPQVISFNKPVTASSNPDPRFNDKSSVNNGNWVGSFWKPAEDDKNPWIEIDLENEELISNVIIYESGIAITAFELQYKSGGKWKTIHKGDLIGKKAEINLPPTKLQNFRLAINKFSDVPGIYEIILL